MHFCTATNDDHNRTTTTTMQAQLAAPFVLFSLPAAAAHCSSLDPTMSGRAGAKLQSEMEKAIGKDCKEEEKRKISEIIAALHDDPDLVKACHFAVTKGYLKKKGMSVDDSIPGSSTKMSLISNKLMFRTVLAIGHDSVAEPMLEKIKATDHLAMHKLFYVAVGDAPDSKVWTRSASNFIDYYKVVAKTEGRSA
jgi:hypothetical protein